MIIIAAMSARRVIGTRNGLPWNIPEEYQQFVDFVNGNTVIMGRRSYEIFGADLGETNMIVVSRSAKQLHRATVVDSIPGAVEHANSLGKTVFSAGGASIYEQTIPLADTMYLSYIHGDYDGDTFFPAFDESEWHAERTEDHRRFRFVIWKRRSRV
jgi:dihydrofolate reductase